MKDFIYGKNDGVIDVKVLNDKIAIVVVCKTWNNSITCSVYTLKYLNAKTHTYHIWSTDGTDSGTQLLGISQYPVKYVLL